ncbi:MAG: hypothetical protein MUC72_00650 [Acidobacteria bacterium]|jgi:hypothetical protein|nr:hypothetical protein [Acidobacteriota bacterium]
MKEEKWRLVSFVVVLLFVGQTLVFGTAYLRRCKGGSILIDPEFNKLAIHLNIAASHTHVGAGETAWVDRTLNADEQPGLILKNPLAGMSVGTITVTSMGSGNHFLGKTVFGSLTPLAEKLARAVFSNREYLIMVEKIGGFFEIVSIQPYL